MKIASLVLFLCSWPVFGQTTAVTTNHYEVLKKAQMFSLAGGFTGATSPAGHSLMAVARQKDAVTVFRKLTSETSPTAQLFGLLGLRTIGAEEFKHVLPTLLGNKTEVTVLHGCIVTKQDVASVAKEIEQGRWDFELAPSEARKRARGSTREH